MRNGLLALGRQLRSTARKQGPWSSVHRFPRTSEGLPHRSYASLSAAEFQFGQPLHETHPHLLKPGERTDPSSQLRVMLTQQTVTPGITALEYAQRRSNLASKLPKNGIALLAASELKYRSGPVFYEFHQDSDFFYLTGTMDAPDHGSG